ncbi:MAG: DUF3987 domain-containing protein [Bacteroidales bacterium]
MINPNPFLALDFAVLPVTIRGGEKSPACSKEDVAKLQMKQLDNIVFRANIGIFAGKASGGLEVLDFDTKYDTTGTLWQDFKDHCEMADIDLDKFYIVQTMSGGYHIYYRCEKIEGNKKIARKADTRQAIIETRGEGGWVVAPPTKGYSDICGSISSVPRISIEEREKLWAICKLFDELPEEFIEDKQKERKVYQGGKESPFDACNRENPLKWLIDAGWKQRGIRGETVYLIRPGSNSRTPHATLRPYGDTWIFYCFSSNGYPFDMKGYNPVGVYSKLTNITDKKELARALSGEGFGEYQEKKSTPRKEYRPREKKGASEGDFPFHVFPDEIQTLIEDYSEKRAFSKVLLANSIMAVFSGAIGLNYRYELSNGWEGFANLYMVMVGRASISKSPTMKFAMSPIMDLEKDWYESHQYQFADWEVRKASNKKGFSEPAPTRRKMMLNDATIEALIKIHSANKKGLILFRDELAGWLNSFNNYRGGSGADQQNYLSIWDNAAVSNERAGREQEQFLPESYLTIFGGIQPKILNDFAKGNRKDDGFLLRFLFCFAEEAEKPTLWTDLCKKPNAELYLKYKEAVKFYGFMPKEANPITLTFSPEAERVWSVFYDKNRTDLHKTENEDLASLTSKLEKYTTRLALLLQLIDNVYSGDVFNTVISADSMQGALDLIAYYKSSAIKALDIIEENQESDARLAGAIDWRKIFGEDEEELSTSELVARIYEQTGKSERTAKSAITAHLTKVRHGVWKL